MIVVVVHKKVNTKNLLQIKGLHKAIGLNSHVLRRQSEDSTGNLLSCASTACL